MAISRALIGLILGVALSTFASQVGADEKNRAAVIAEVDGHKVTRADLEQKQAAKLLQARYQQYVAEREALDQFIIAVRAVLQGEIFISPVMSNRMVYDHIHGGDYSRSPVDRLSDRELEVLQLIGKGHDMRDIAKGLNLSAKTVETHRAHIKEKLNLANAREVTRFATNWLMLQQQA